MMRSAAPTWGHDAVKHLLQYILDGLSIGSIYALIALGLVVVYRGTGHINFAQGEMALFSTLVTWWLHDKGVPLLLAIAISAALAFVGGALIEVGLMRPAGRRSAFGPVVVAIGLFQGLNSLSGLLFPKSGQGLPFPSLFPRKPKDFVSIFGAAWRSRANRRARGRAGDHRLALRPVPEDQDRTGDAHRRQQCDVSEVGRRADEQDPDVQLGAGRGDRRDRRRPEGGHRHQRQHRIDVLGVPAVGSGGDAGRPRQPGGAVIGGLSLGVIESLVGNYPHDWPASDWIGIKTKTVVAFLIILIVLLVRPSGLFGSSRVERV